ncbi:hypothetical protein ACFS6H_08435 [Terrimonas rubra]|uniref:DUF4476 domain-containing protein n=1 Tax=Terrimonas rubra TaxID=1035890 RepID=A0ABW6A317_9BACT
MRKIVFGMSFLLMASVVLAQRTNFVYLQTDPQQPFFIKLNEKGISSSAAGYLILPKLTAGTYTITIGFAGGKLVEQKFDLQVQNSDKGYLIKQLGGGELSLFDLQTAALLPAANAKGSTVVTKLEKENVSAFTNALSKASADTTLLYGKPKQETPVTAPVVVKQEPKPAETQPAAVQTPAAVTKEIKDTLLPLKETLVAEKETKAVVKETVTPVKEEAVAVTETVKETVVPPAVPADKPVITPAETAVLSSTIQRKAVTETGEGTTVVYEEAFENGSKELITIIVPPAKEIFKETPATTTQQPILKANICKNNASEKDFLAVRRKMVAKTNDEAMIEEAEKVFKTKCFTTTQVKNLGNMFLSNAGKYNFFAMAKNYVSDINNFPGLAAELKDNFYIGQFNKLIQ